MMSQLLKYITKYEGVTAKELADATGLPIKQVRAELSELNKAGKLTRWRAPVGQSDLWWRWDMRPMTDHTLMLLLALAIHFGKPDKKLREIARMGGKRAQSPYLRAGMAMMAQAINIRELAEDAIQFYREQRGLTGKKEATNAAGA